MCIIKNENRKEVTIPSALILEPFYFVIINIQGGW